MLSDEASNDVLHLDPTVEHGLLTPKQGQPLALPYSKAILSMVPTHDCKPDSEPFEAINEMHQHSYTQQQIFLPTSESRHFTRADAAKAFGDFVLPPEKKMWVPELLQFEK